MKLLKHMGKRLAGLFVAGAVFATAVSNGYTPKVQASTADVTTKTETKTVEKYVPLVITNDSWNMNGIATKNDYKSANLQPDDFYFFDKTFAESIGSDPNGAFKGKLQTGYFPVDGKIQVGDVPYQATTNYEDKDCIVVSKANNNMVVKFQETENFDKLYFLATVGGVGYDRGVSFKVTLNYETGESVVTNYTLYDWCNDKIKTENKNPYYEKLRRGTNTKSKQNEGRYGYTTSKPYLQSVSVNIDKNRKLESVTVTYNDNRNDLFCAIFAVTGYAKNTYNWIYEAEDNKITVTTDDPAYDTTNNPLEIIVTAEDELYTGNPYSSAKFEDILTEVTGDEEPVIYYEGILADGTVYEKTTIPPTEVGDYKATVTVNGVTAVDEFKIGEVKIVAEDEYYTGNPYSSVEIDVPDFADEESVIYYEGTLADGTTYEKTTVPPTEVGTYTATLVVGDAVAEDDFEIIHVHEFEYEAEDNKITAECEDDDCELNDQEIIIIVIAEDELYTGNPYSSAELEDKLTDITGDEEPVIYYEGTLADGTVYEKTTVPPTEVGDYKATVTVNGVTAVDEFKIDEVKIVAEDEYYTGNPYSSVEIDVPDFADEESVIYYEGTLADGTTYEKTTVPPTEVGTYTATLVVGDAVAEDDFEIIHVHEFEYEAEDNKITAECEDDDCELNDQEIIIIVIAEDEYYTGNPYSSAELEDKLTDITGDEEPVIYYEGTLADGTVYEKTTVPPTEVGEYKATVTVGGVTAEDEFEIVELKITAEDEYYTGNEYSSAEVEMPLETEDELVVYYEGIGDTEYEKTTVPPTEVGTYKATAVLGEATAEDEFNILPVEEDEVEEDEVVEDEIEEEEDINLEEPEAAPSDDEEDTTENESEEAVVEEEEEDIDLEEPEAAPSDDEEDTIENESEEAVVEEEEEDIDLEEPEAAPGVDAEAETGDNSNLTVLFVIMLVSTLGLLVSRKLKTSLSK